MHRQHLLRMLERYLAKHRDERDVAEKIMALVREHVDCFERSCRPGHITGSAWILSHDRQHCLLVHHRKLDRWLQPGGHADGQTHIVSVALREAQEETGLEALGLPVEGAEIVPLDIDVHQIPERRDASGSLIEDAHEHHDIRFLLIAAQGQELVLSDESHDLGWFTHDDVLNLTNEESVLRMMRKAGPGKGNIQ